MRGSSWTVHYQGEDCLKLDDFAEWLNRQTIEITEDN